MKLFRYVSFETFVDLIQTQSLYFVYPPKKWDDAFEGFLYRAIKTPEGKQKVFSLLPTVREREFAEGVLCDDSLSHTRYQCWSQARDTIAMWSIYHYSNRALMIATTSDKILELEVEDQKIKLDKVNYVKTISLEQEVKAINWPKCHTPDIFKTKRSEFKHEREYRAHVGVLQKINCEDPLNVPITNVQEFIVGVLVHPAAPAYYVKIVDDYCRINKIKFWGQSRLLKFEC